MGDCILNKSATFPLLTEQQPQALTERPEVFKIIDKESVELTLDNNPQLHSSSAAGQEEIRESFDNDFSTVTASHNNTAASRKRHTRKIVSNVGNPIHQRRNQDQ